MCLHSLFSIPRREHFFALAFVQRNICTCFWFTTAFRQERRWWFAQASCGDGELFAFLTSSRSWIKVKIRISGFRRSTFEIFFEKFLNAKHWMTTLTLVCSYIECSGRFKFYLEWILHTAHIYNFKQTWKTRPSRKFIFSNFKIFPEWAFGKIHEKHRRMLTAWF